MKKLTVIMISVAMAAVVCSCGKDNSAGQSAGVSNPMHGCTYEEMIEKTGLDILAPAEAEDPQYSYIEMDGQAPIAQVQFVYDKLEYCYRAQASSATSIMTDVSGDELASPDDLAKSLADGVNIGAALSGMYYDWASSAAVDVFPAGEDEAGREGICAWNEGKEGFVSWLDTAPGVLYCMSISDQCTQSALMNAACNFFHPMQGNAE